MQRKENRCALLVGMQTGAASIENSIKFPLKIKYGSAFWPSYPTSGNKSQGAQNTNLKDNKHPYIHCSVIYNYQDLEAPKCPSVGEWMKQLWDMYTADIYYTWQ